MKINGRTIGPDQPPYVIAELSANHNGDIGQAFAIMEAARSAGALEIVLLHRVSGYPALASHYDFETIPDMVACFGVMKGLAGHTLDNTTARE